MIIAVDFDGTLCKECYPNIGEANKELIDTIERYTDGLVFTMQLNEIVETLSAAKTPKKDGKGNPYIDVISAHMPLLEAMQTVSRKAFKKAFAF